MLPAVAVSPTHAVPVRRRQMSDSRGAVTRFVSIDGVLQARIRASRTFLVRKATSCAFTSGPSMLCVMRAQKGRSRNHAEAGERSRSGRSGYIPLCNRRDRNALVTSTSNMKMTRERKTGEDGHLNIRAFLLAPTARKAMHGHGRRIIYVLSTHVAVKVRENESGEIRERGRRTGATYPTPGEKPVMLKTFVSPQRSGKEPP